MPIWLRDVLASFGGVILLGLIALAYLGWFFYCLLPRGPGSGGH